MTNPGGATRSTLEELLGDQGLPGVVVVTAPHCPHCRTVAPIVERVAAAHEGRVQIVGVDASQVPEQARALKVRGTPTLLAARDGVVVARHVGAGGTAEVEGVFAAAAGEGTGGGVGTTNRRLRTLAGAAVLTIALFADSWILATIGVAFIAAGWYDLLLPKKYKK